MAKEKLSDLPEPWNFVHQLSCAFFSLSCRFSPEELEGLRNFTVLRSLHEPCLDLGEKDWQCVSWMALYHDCLAEKVTFQSIEELRAAVVGDQSVLVPFTVGRSRGLPRKRVLEKQLVHVLFVDPENIEKSDHPGVSCSGGINLSYREVGRQLEKFARFDGYNAIVLTRRKDKKKA